MIGKSDGCPSSASDRLIHCSAIILQLFVTFVHLSKIFVRCETALNVRNKVQGEGEYYGLGLLFLMDGNLGQFDIYSNTSEIRKM